MDDNLVRSKRANQTVDDVESVSDQPVQKSARREEEPSSNAPSRNELDIKKELDNELEKRLSARLEEARAESESAQNYKIENATLKDKFEAAKRDEEIAKSMHFELAANNFTLKKELDESKRKERDSSLEISALKNELEETRRKAEEDRMNDGARIDELTRENNSLKLEDDSLRKRGEAANRRNDEEYSALESEFDEVRLKKEAAIRMRDELAQENNSLKLEMDGLRKRLEAANRMNGSPSNENAVLKGELDETRRKAEEDRARIDELTQKLSDSEEQVQLLRSRCRRLKRHECGNKFDIFQLCIPDTAHSMSIDDAVSQLKPELEKVDAKKKNRFLDYCFENREYAQHITPHNTCKLCKETYRKPGVLFHFLSTKHILQVRGEGAAVPRNAVKYWLDELQLASTAKLRNDWSLR